MWECLCVCLEYMGFLSDSWGGRLNSSHYKGQKWDQGHFPRLGKCSSAKRPFHWSGAWLKGLCLDKAHGEHRAPMPLAWDSPRDPWLLTLLNGSPRQSSREVMEGKEDNQTLSKTLSFFLVRGRLVTSASGSLHHHSPQAIKWSYRRSINFHYIVTKTPSPSPRVPTDTGRLSVPIPTKSQLRNAWCYIPFPKEYLGKETARPRNELLLALRAKAISLRVGLLCLSLPSPRRACQELWGHAHIFKIT